MRDCFSHNCRTNSVTAIVRIQLNAVDEQDVAFPYFVLVHPFYIRIPFICFVIEQSCVEFVNRVVDRVHGLEEAYALIDCSISHDKENLDGADLHLVIGDIVKFENLTSYCRYDPTRFFIFTRCSKNEMDGRHKWFVTE